MQAYKNLIDKDISAIQQRKSSMGLCRCLFELGGYYHAIDSGKYALDVDRHFPGVHKYIALSEERIGNIESAKKLMCRAVLYETPWDEGNVMENLKALNEIVSRA